MSNLTSKTWLQQAHDELLLLSLIKIDGLFYCPRAFFGLQATTIPEFTALSSIFKPDNPRYCVKTIFELIRQFFMEVLTTSTSKFFSLKIEHELTKLRAAQEK